MRDIDKKRLQYLKKNSGVEEVLDTYPDLRYTQFTCSQGGDIDVYRVYGDSPETFMITMK